MFCAQCGNATADNARYCRHCGAPLEVPTQPLEASETTAPDVQPIHPASYRVAQTRPWVRYWARTFDIYVALVFGSLAVGSVYPNAFDAPGSDQVWALFILIAWVFVESILIATIGTTPGKWLFKTRLIPPSGYRADFGTALSRSIKVWWRGLGIGFPLVTLVTLPTAYGNLKKDGITSWDKDEGFTVVHDRIGILRVAFAVVFFTGVLLIAVMASATNA